MKPRFNTKLFTDVFPTYDSFKSCFDNDFEKYAKDCIANNYLNTLYWLLFARYGANPINNMTENLFKARLVAITWQKGPTWVRRVQLQDSLRALTESDLLSGAKTILNAADHPETPPSTDTDTELTYIKAQNVSKIKRSKLDAYSYLNDVLKNDVTEEFIQSYAKLFTKFVTPLVTRIYENDIEDEDEEV